MVDFLKNVDGKVADLAILLSVLDVARDISEKGSKLVAPGTSWPDRVALVRALIDAPDLPALVDLFNAADLGAERTAWAAKLAPLAKTIDNLDKRFGVLIESVGAYNTPDTKPDAGLFSVKLEVPSKALEFKGVGIELGAKAEFEIEAGERTWPFASTPGMNIPLLRLEAKGKATASVDADIPFNMGHIAVTTTASASDRLGYYYNLSPADAASTPVAVAAAKRLADLPNPFDLADVARVFDSSDLIALEMAPQGNTELKVTIGLGADFELAKGVSGKFDLAVDARVSLAGQYALTLRKLPRLPGQEHPIECIISRSRRSENELGVALGVELDLAGLAARLRSMLTTYSGFTGNLLAKVRPLLSPGTYVRDQLATKVAAVVAGLNADAAFKAALNKDARAVLGYGRAGGISAFLTDEITGVLDRVSGTLNGTAAAAAGQVADKAIALLGAQYAELTGVPAANAQLKAAISGLIGDYTAKAATELAALTTPEFEALDKLLGEAGVVITGVANAADKALAGLRQLVDKHDALLARITGEVENEARRRIRLRIAESETRWAGKGYQVKGVFNNSGDGAQAIYRQLWKGNWEQIAALLATNSPDFTLDREASRVTLSAGAESEGTLDLIIFGFGISAKRTILSEGTIAIDGFGNLLLVSKAEIDDAINGVRGAIRFQFADVLSLAFAGRSNGALTAELGFGINWEDQNLTRGEVEAFVKSLENAGLLASGATLKASSLFDRWIGPGKERKLAGQLRTRLALDNRQFRALQDAVYPMFDPQKSRRLELFGVAFGRLNVVVDGREERAIAAIRERLFNSQAGKALSDLQVLMNLVQSPITEIQTLGKLDLDKLGGLMKWQDEPDVVKLMEGVVRAYGLVEALDTLYRLSVLVPETDLEAQLREIRASQKRIANQVDDWFRVKSKLLRWVSPEVSDRSIALLKVMQDIVKLGGAATPGMTLSMARKVGKDEEVVVLI